MYSYTGAELTETTLELNRSTLAGGGSGRRGHPLQQGMVVTAADDKGTHNSRAAAAADNEGTQNSRAVAAVYNEVTLREQVQRVAQVGIILGGVRVDTVSYVRRFGLVSPESPYGSRVWAGIQEELSLWRQFPTRRSPEHAFPGFRLQAGWFNCPRPFSRRQAAGHISMDDPGEQRWYPAAFIIHDEIYYMWCLAIVIGRSQYWVVDSSRVWLTDYNFQ